MAFKMKGHTLPGINQRIDKSSTEDGRAKSSAFQKAKCAPGSGPGDGCGGNFKVNKKGTVISRALNKAGGNVKRGLDSVVSNIKKGNKKRKKKRNTVTTDQMSGKTLAINPNLAKNYKNKETRSKETLDKILKHNY